MMRSFIEKHFSRTAQQRIRTARFQIYRARARLLRSLSTDVVPASRKLHLGSGTRRVDGWLNVDVAGSDYDVDLGAAKLPWKAGAFETAVSQHVIEHLELESELLPLLAELNRVLEPGGTIWLSCPDIEKICTSYVQHRMKDLIADRQSRIPGFSLGPMPSSQMINELFHQGGEHRNLFDFELLEWALTTAGFREVRRVDEADLLRSHPGFPPRNDDKQSLYVVATSGRS